MCGSARICFLLGLYLAGCGSDSEPSTVPHGPPGCGEDALSLAVTTGEFEPVEAPGTACGAIITQEPIPTAAVVHSPNCGVLRYSSNPPSSGDHYLPWADYQEYTSPISRGNWVHSMEHGAVAILHHCDDCEEELEVARDMIDALPEETPCASFARLRRVVMTPDPLLDVRWAAASWGYTLRSTCFEPEVFAEFVTEHTGNAPEDTCYPPG
jgi:hypothetical protein